MHTALVYPVHWFSWKETRCTNLYIFECFVFLHLYILVSVHKYRWYLENHSDINDLIVYWGDQDKIKHFYVIFVIAVSFETSKAWLYFMSLCMWNEMLKLNMILLFFLFLDVAFCCRFTIEYFDDQMHFNNRKAIHAILLLLSLCNRYVNIR